jgi:NAD+ synthase (glutamine-hydrolysing)
MDMANKHNALVVGTGDLSELALGWCTYNGDHMSMYGVNASVPKTLIRHLVNYFAKVLDNDNKKASTILKDILNTPVSPELLPPNEDGTIKQITENSIGSYVTHDFIIYYMLRYKFAPSKIYKMYLSALKQYNEENGIKEEVNKEIILKDFKTFYNRFFSQQFKRNCLPDGVKVGSISLSPRGDWKMPSDANKNLWLDDLNNLT